MRRDPIPTPFDAYRDVVRREWTDHNHHMNVGYYGVVFDLATDEWLDFVGLTTEHRTREQISTFCLESHLTYQREVQEGDALRFTTQLLDYDSKRIHYIHQMTHAEAGFLSATAELLSLHVSRETRRATPMTATILAHLAAIRDAHERLERPPEVGRVMGLRSRPTTR